MALLVFAVSVVAVPLAFLAGWSLFKGLIGWLPATLCNCF